MFAELCVNEPSLVLLEEPRAGSRIEDVLRYGMSVGLRKVKGEWAYILHGREGGWVPYASLISPDTSFVSNACVDRRGAYLFSEKDTQCGPFLALPFESPLQVLELEQRWATVRLLNGNMAYIQRSGLLFSRPLMGLEEMVAFSKTFLGLKYLYGGTTSFGYDCSGFVQMLYRQRGIALYRNSYEQVQDPRFSLVDQGEQGAGDLVFFFNRSGKVVHVAMMINKEEFIHSFTRQEAWICLGRLEDSRWVDGTVYSGLVIKKLKKKL